MTTASSGRWTLLPGSGAALTFGGMAAEKAESPEITFKAGDVTKRLTECPGGKVEIELSREAAEFPDAKNGKQIGPLFVLDLGGKGGGWAVPPAPTASVADGDSCRGWTSPGALQTPISKDTSREADRVSCCGGSGCYRVSLNARRECDMDRSAGCKVGESCCPPKQSCGC